MSIPYADIIILALIAGFILLRLRNVLGQDAGFDPRSDERDKPRDITPQRGEEQGILPIVPLRHQDINLTKEKILVDEKEKKLLESLSPSHKDTINEIKQLEPSFNLCHFIEGAKSAFEMVLRAFHENDKETLQHLLADDIEDMFVKEAQQRHDAAIKTDVTLVAIPNVTVTNITLNKKHAVITVEFISEQVTVERNTNGDIVGGDASHSERVEDEWVFERDLGSRNPNWTITAT